MLKSTACCTPRLQRFALLAVLFVVQSSSNPVHLQSPSEMMNQTQTSPVLLLKGSRWPVENTFSTFDKQLTIQQKPGDQGITEHEAKTGLIVWDAAVVLAKYFENTEEFPANYFRNKKIIELGAGCGLVGLCLASQGALITITDLPQLVPFIAKNIELNNLQEVASAKPLMWGTDPFQTVDRVEYDFIIASDCLWVDYLVESFVETLQQLASPNSIILISHEQRAKRTENMFMELAAKYFDIDQVPLVKMHSEYRNPYISIFQLKQKSR